MRISLVTSSYHADTNSGAHTGGNTIIDADAAAVNDADGLWH